MSGNSILADQYKLLDSGDFMKLESVGGKTIARPSSLCMWRKKLAERAWKEADATYTPKKGWRTQSKEFGSWDVQFQTFKLRLRLQDNGQIGIFPEHAEYLDPLTTLLSSRPTNGQSNARVLNMFAFTGMASVVLLNSGCHVCHVDLSKKALSWAKENFELNNIAGDRYRLIPEDSISFMEREKRRGNKYDLILIDPPSFSRSGAKTSWKLEDVIKSMMQGCADLLSESGALVFSCHHAVINAAVLRNLILDITSPALTILQYEDLAISESVGRRRLPAGAFVLCRRSA